MFVNINRVIELNAIVYAAIQWCMLGRSKQIKANNNVTQPKEMYWICQIFHHKVSTNTYDCLWYPTAITPSHLFVTWVKYFFFRLMHGILNHFQLSFAILFFIHCIWILLDTTMRKTKYSNITLKLKKINFYTETKKQFHWSIEYQNCGLNFWAVICIFFISFRIR